MPTAPDTLVLLLFDGVRLAVPRVDVRAVEAAVDVVRDPALEAGVGWIESAGGPRPVFCLDADLQCLSQAPATRRVCVVLGALGVPGAGSFGLLCDDFVHIVARTAPWQPLPPALCVAGSPLGGLLLLDDVVACTTSAAALARALPLPSHGTADTSHVIVAAQ